MKRFFSVVCEKKGSWAKITMDNPKKRNVLNLSAIRSLRQHIVNANSDPNIKAIQIYANGPVFSSGHDLKEVKDDQSCFGQISQLCQDIKDNKKPVVAMVKGFATAAGCQLAAACTFSIAHKDAHFACSGIKIGLFCSTPGV